MSGSNQRTGKELCGKWMPRKKTTCARKPLHKGDCRTAEALADNRQRKTARRRGTRAAPDPVARSRWNQAYKLSRYGLAQEQFDRLLEIQEYACAMCSEPFEEGQQICIDHDHDHCKAEKRSCGKCVRGLLCLSRNTALGQIERKYDLARAYLDSPPGQLIVRTAQAA
jgi:hypothetical protein